LDLLEDEDLSNPQISAASTSSSYNLWRALRVSSCSYLRREDSLKNVLLRILENLQSRATWKEQNHIKFSVNIDTGNPCIRDHGTRKI